jgi:ADP-ribose pyrophosphatase
MKKEAQPHVVAAGKYIELVRQNGWEFARRKGISGIVGIIAVTDDRKLVLVEQHRPPVGARVIELPAGLAGDAKGHEKEDLADAARRELLEETGYVARRMERLAVHEVPLGDVAGWLAAREREKKLIDLKVYCGLYFARLD